jgi:hypothetical protein
MLSIIEGVLERAGATAKQGAGERLNSVDMRSIVEGVLVVA